MADSLPSFGDTSGIDSAGTSIHHHQTLLITGSTEQMDSQETTFNDSQSTSQRIEHLTSNEICSDTISIIMETAAELPEGESSALVVEDTLNIGEESPNVDHHDTDVASEQETHSSDQGMESVCDDGTENTEGGEVSAGAGGSDYEQDGDEEPGEKFYQLPISKIKRIMKTDPDTKLITKDALTAMAISTEHFLAMLAQQSFKLAVRSKKKRIALEHVKSTITSSASCDFLEGTIPEFDI